MLKIDSLYAARSSQEASMLTPLQFIIFHWLPTKNTSAPLE
jgi:hypothetical protein